MAERALNPSRHKSYPGPGLYASYGFESKMRAALCVIFFILSTCVARMSAQTLTPESPDTTFHGEDTTFVIEGDSLIKVTDSIAAPPSRRPPRKVTPVDIDENKPQTVLHFYDKHGNPLDEPVLFLATLDTVTKAKSKPVYPIYNGLSIGLNFGDLIMKAAGQSYGSYDVWADVSLHNWFFPVLEAGLGFADSSPKNSNFTYRTNPSFYCKLGINYNFLYKSSPDYQLYFGLRGGFSSFSYDVDNIDISNSYWGETDRFSLKGLHATAIYGEALMGIKVKIYKHFSLGWNIRYHMKFKVSDKSLSTPWFIPGYGASSPLSIAVSAIYTLPGPKTEEAAAQDK